MKNTFKKLGALVLAVVMIMAMSTTAFAADLGGTEPGVAGTWTADDTPIQQDKTINILKEITVFNPDETYVYGPAITYTYAIESASGSELVQITDGTEDHASGVATVFPKALGAADITSGTPSLTGQDNDGTTLNAIRWLNTDILEANTVTDGGTANYKKLAIDFSGVVFSKPGVYRYKLTETAPAAATMTAAGVTDGTATSVRYLDVYVMRSNVDDATYDLYTDGTTAAQWIIYGYVCLDSTVGTTDVTTATKKTNGFTANSEGATSGGTTADQYYTYNLTVTKDLVGDNSMINHQFPMAVAFDTATKSKTGTFQLIVETDGSESTVGGTGLTATADVVAGAATVNDPTTGTTAAIKKIGGAQVLSTSNYTFKVADGSTTTGTTEGKVKLIGIPYGVLASVTETNDNVGTTYTATAKEDVTTAAGTTLLGDKALTTTGTLSANTYSASIDNTETATRAADIATANTNNMNAAVEFTNTLSIISPTGVVLRIAPYALMLGAGIVLFLLSRRRKEENEA